MMRAFALLILFAAAVATASAQDAYNQLRRDRLLSIENAEEAMVVAKSSKAPIIKSSKAPTVKSDKSSKAPIVKVKSVKSSKAPIIKSSKAPTMKSVKSSKAPIVKVKSVKSSKAPFIKPSKAPKVDSQASTKAAKPACNKRCKRRRKEKKNMHDRVLKQNETAWRRSIRRKVFDTKSDIRE